MTSNPAVDEDSMTSLNDKKPQIVDPDTLDPTDESQDSIIDPGSPDPIDPDIINPAPEINDPETINPDPDKTDPEPDFDPALDPVIPDPGNKDRISSPDTGI